ncbi:hypothetical protein [Kitasatospora sp. NPDC048407]|uniref:hypothetical protein n=1 Tax=Kitasatospora sp. NPDC048407 TaxID=3364051 RepID=UPI003715633F
MGAGDWHYVTPYSGSPQRSLDALHQAEFAAHWAGQEYDTLRDEIDWRWTGKYVLLHTHGEPTHLGIFGRSGD